MKKFLIVFPYDYLPYSPTTLNMITMLSRKGSVDVATFFDVLWQDVLESFPCRYLFIYIPSWVQKIFSKIFRCFPLLKACLLYCKLKKNRDHYDLVFAVDSLSYVMTRKVYDRVVYVSLEIFNDSWLRCVKKLGVEMLLIQSEVRKNFLFGQAPVNYRLLPNSPLMKPSGKNTMRPLQRRKLIYMGYVHPSHGVEVCIDSLKYLDKDFSLTLKGLFGGSYKGFVLKKYAELISNGRLILDDTYESQDRIGDYLKNFDLGFCLYDMQGVLAGDFNYISCPSGKMHFYFAAGLPIVGQNIMGLQDVRDYDAGILIDRPSPANIAEAVKNIFENYSAFSDGSLNAGKALSFEAHFESIMAELLAEYPQTSMNRGL